MVILLLDALCGKDKDDRPVEWIKEEILAESLHLHIKLVRKTLRFLEQVLLQAAALQSCLQSCSVKAHLCHNVLFQLTASKLPVSWESMTMIQHTMPAYKATWLLARVPSTVPAHSTYVLSGHSSAIKLIV